MSMSNLRSRYLGFLLYLFLIYKLSLVNSLFLYKFCSDFPASDSLAGCGQYFIILFFYLWIFVCFWFCCFVCSLLFWCWFVCIFVVCSLFVVVLFCRKRAKLMFTHPVFLPHSTVCAWLSLDLLLNLLCLTVHNSRTS